MSRLLATRNDPVLTLLRVVLGIVFFAHGAQKALGWWGGRGFSATMTGFESMGIPALFAFLAIAAEFLGGIGLVIGFMGRVAAFGVACTMAVAIALVHWKNGLFAPAGFELNLLALAIAVAILARGSGAFSVDLALTRRFPGRGRQGVPTAATSWR